MSGLFDRDFLLTWEHDVATIRADRLHWRHHLDATSAFITRENVNGLIRDAVRRAEDAGVDVALNWDHFYPLYGDPDGARSEEHTSESSHRT